MEEELEKDMKPKLIGETYMKYPTERSRDKIRYGLYECQYCGKGWEARVYDIKNGTKSCGCQKGKGTITHGLTKNRFYHIWKGILRRCNNLKNKDYKNYGARGITVCEEWLDIRNFVAWAEKTYPNTKGVSLDRIDNDKGYSPENCRWVTREIQNTNQRMRKTNTSGFVGVSWFARDKDWRASITVNNKLIDLGYFKIKEEAVQARDNYITQNNLPHKLSTDYKREA